MTFTRRARELVLVAVLLAVPLLFLRAHMKAPAELNLLDRALLRLSAPAEGLLVGAGRSVGGAWGRYVALWRVSDENTGLRAENARLKGELERTKLEARRAEELERLLKLKAEVKGELFAARVIGAETSPFFRVLRVRIDRGAPELQAGMPVVAAEGVVGRIERVFGGYADVLLAVDPKSAIDVVIPRTGGRGVLKGLPGEDRTRARIDYLLRKDEVQEGDLVVTSGIGGFPRNLPVGRVGKVDKREFGLYQEAEVEPAVGFGKLAEVLVVTGLPLKPAAEGARP